MPNEILISQNKVFEPLDLRILDIRPEAESEDYGAWLFTLNTCKILFRIAKSTPTKIGQFVTLWKRENNGPIQPFDASDDIDLFVIWSRKGRHAGQFVFPKSVLVSKNIVTENDKEGKRAIRVYGPWEDATSHQAKQTQKWQCQYFLDLSEGKTVDLAKAKALYQATTPSLRGA